MALTLGSLCTGIAGLDLAVQELTGAKLTWMAEINKDASKVLAERFPEVPNLGDLKDLTTNTPPAVDVLTAGYPCQPFSWAGHRKGANDERHLWPYIREIIGHIRPRYVFMENVVGHLNLGFGEVVGQLTEMGYRVSWGTLRAADVGAPTTVNGYSSSQPLLPTLIASDSKRRVCGRQYLRKSPALTSVRAYFRDGKVLPAEPLALRIQKASSALDTQNG